MKHRIRTLLLTLALLPALAVPAFAAGRDWESAYTDVLRQTLPTVNGEAHLVDLDLDGTPELLIGHPVGPAMVSYLKAAYTFTNGSVQALSVSGDLFLGFHGTDDADKVYQLYRNDSTGALRVTASYPFRHGTDYQDSVYSTYTLNGQQLSQRGDFRQRRQNGKALWYANGKQVSAQQFETARIAWMEGWNWVPRFQSQTTVFPQTPTAAQCQAFFDRYQDGCVLARPSTHQIQLDGRSVSIPAYGIGGSNYFKLRDIAALLTDTPARFQVDWDAAGQKITLTTGQSYTPAGGELAPGGGIDQIGHPTAAAVRVDGRAPALTAYNLGGSNYFKLRDLGQALGFQVQWDEATRTVQILTAAS